MLKRIKESIAYINKYLPGRPDVGIILGSGLGEFVEELNIEISIPYSEIPHFPISGVDGHKGALLYAKYMDKSILIMQGRVHYYEGYSMQQITYPIRVMKYLGITTLLLSNAAGGMNPTMDIGDLMIISDHINLMPNPLIGPHIHEFGERFPDMSNTYDVKLIDQAFQFAIDTNISIHKGCYIAVSGPSYETPSEYKYFRIIGGDAVGMSTVPEVIVAHQMGIRCFGISVITDLGVDGKIEYLDHTMVQQAAAKAEPKMAAILKNLLSRLC